MTTTLTQTEIETRIGEAQRFLRHAQEELDKCETESVWAFIVASHTILSSLREAMPEFTKESEY